MINSILQIPENFIGELTKLIKGYLLYLIFNILIYFNYLFYYLLLF